MFRSQQNRVATLALVATSSSTSLAQNLLNNNTFAPLLLSSQRGSKSTAKSAPKKNASKKKVVAAKKVAVKASPNNNKKIQQQESKSTQKKGSSVKATTTTVRKSENKKQPVKEKTSKTDLEENNLETKLASEEEENEAVKEKEVDAKKKSEKNEQDDEEEKEEVKTAFTNINPASNNLNKINWSDLQSKLQHYNVQVSSSTSSGSAVSSYTSAALAEIASQARATIRSVEVTYHFIGDSPKVCSAEHADTLSVSIAIELINIALRFSVPQTSPFVNGLFCFLHTNVSSTGRTSLLSNENVVYLSHIVNGCTTVANLRVWDERLFQRHPQELQDCLNNAVSLTEAISMVNAIGNKEIGASRNVVQQYFSSSFSSSSTKDFGSAADDSVEDSSASLQLLTSSDKNSNNHNNNKLLIISPSNLIPKFFEKLLDRIESFVVSATRDDNNDESTATKMSPAAQHQLEQKRSIVIDAVNAFSEAQISTDPSMRERLSSWITALIRTTPPRYLLSPLITAATTLRLEDGCFTAATRKVYELQQLQQQQQKQKQQQRSENNEVIETLSQADLCRVLSALTMLPHKPLLQVPLIRKDNGRMSTMLLDSSFATATTPTKKNEQDAEAVNESITMKQLAETARDHLWKFNNNNNTTSLPHQINSALLPKKLKFELVDASGNIVSEPLLANKSFTSQVPKEIRSAFAIQVSEASDHEHDEGVLLSHQEGEEKENNNNNEAMPPALIPDRLPFVIAESLAHSFGDTSSDSVSSQNIVSFLAGAVALGIKNHAAVSWVAKHSFKTLIFSASTESSQIDYKNNKRLQTELEFLAISPTFLQPSKVQQMLSGVLKNVKSKIEKYQAVKMDVEAGDEESASSLLVIASNRAAENSSIFFTTMQLRLLCDSTLAVKHNLSPDMASFFLHNLVKLVHEASLAEISAVLYAAGRADVITSHSDHTQIGRRVGTILKISRAKKGYASAKIGSLRGNNNNNNKTSSTSASTASSPNEITAHDLAVAISGLHLTKFRWDLMPNLFSELSEAISARARRYTPAQCCQLVAIAKDISRTATLRGNPTLSNDATKLARKFLPQIRLSVPSATEQDLLPLLAWLSTGRIRDVSLLDLIMERLVVLRANPEVSISILETIKHMGLLGGVNSDVVYRLIQVMLERNGCPMNNTTTSAALLKKKQQQQQQQKTSGNETTESTATATTTTPTATIASSSSLYTAAEQNATLAYNALQLRSRDISMIQHLILSAKDAKSIKALSSVIGALSTLRQQKSKQASNSSGGSSNSNNMMIGSVNSKEFNIKELIRTFTKQLQATLEDADKFEAERIAAATLGKQKAPVLSESSFVDENFAGFADTPSQERVNDNVLSGMATANRMAAKSSREALTPEKQRELQKQEAEDKVNKRSLNPELLKMVVASTNNHNIAPSSLGDGDVLAVAGVEGGNELAERRRKQYLYNTRDIDIECLMAAMTAMASNVSSPPQQRVKVLNKLCKVLDKRLSQLPALRSQTQIKRDQQDYDLANDGELADDLLIEGNAGSSNNSVKSLTTTSNNNQALPLGPLTKMLTEVAAHNLPVFSIFRTCGKCYSAPGALLHMTPHDSVQAISAYAAFGFRDDYVIRALGMRCFALRSSIVKNHSLFEQCSAAMKVFHIDFDHATSKKFDMFGGQAKVHQRGGRESLEHFK